MVERNVIARCLGALALVATLASAVSCSRNRTADSTTDDENALIIFANESLDQATIFLVATGSNAIRIGNVMAGRTDTLVVPREILIRGTVNIVARLLTRSYAPSSGPVTILSGDALDVRLGINDRLLTVLPARP